MPRLVTEEQIKQLEENVLSLDQIFTRDEMKKFAEEHLYRNSTLPDVKGNTIPTSSKILIRQTRISQAQNFSGHYVLEFEGKIFPQDRIFRHAEPGQAVYFNDNFIGNVKSGNTGYSPYRFKNDQVFQNDYDIELEIPFPSDLFTRSLRVLSYLEATVSDRGLVFGSGSDFEDLAKLTLEEEKLRELKSVCVVRNWFPLK